MKLNKFFLFSAAVGLALASCSDDVAVTSPDNGQVAKGNTYLTMAVTMTQPGTRASNSEVGEYEGTDAEKKVSSIQFLKGTADQENFNVFKEAVTNGIENTVDTLEFPNFWKKDVFYKTGVFTTDPSGTPIDLAVLLNGNTLTEAVRANASGSTNVVDIALSSSNGGDVVKNTKLFMDNGFTMSSESKKKTILGGITRKDAFDGTDETKNNFDFDVRRLLVKGVVVGKNADYELKDKAGVALGKISKTGMTFAGVNGATKTNVLYTTLNQSAIHSVAAAGTAEDAVTNGLVRLGNLKDQGTKDFGPYTAQAVHQDVADFATESADNLGKLDGVYFFENTSNDYSSTMAKVGYNRYAYAKVYVTYVPDDALVRDIKTSNEEKAGYTKFTNNKGTEVWGTWDSEYKYSTAAAAEDGHKYLYYSMKTGYLYGSVDAALMDNNARTDLYTYVDGRMAYRALWNRVEVSPTDHKIKDAGALRNNIYVLEISSFQGLGMPWDPADPKDPNLPKTDEDGPTPPGTTPDVNPQESTFMRVNAKVIPWTVTRRSVNLGEY